MPSVKEFSLVRGGRFSCPSGEVRDQSGTGHRVSGYAPEYGKARAKRVSVSAVREHQALLWCPAAPSCLRLPEVIRVTSVSAERGGSTRRGSVGSHGRLWDLTSTPGCLRRFGAATSKRLHSMQHHRVGSGYNVVSRRSSARPLCGLCRGQETRRKPAEVFRAVSSKCHRDEML